MTATIIERIKSEEKAEIHTEFEKTEKPLDDVLLKTGIGTDFTYKHEIVWINAILLMTLNIFGLWGLLRLITGKNYLKTFLWGFFVAYFGTEGVTIGAHRLFTHKSFKAKPILRAILIFGQTVAGQNSVYVWSRDHRLHHRYTDTDGDPHNSKRGFFFSHMGWLIMKKHPLVMKLGKNIDMSDLKADRMIMFQKKYFFPLYLIFAFLIPVWIPIAYFNETWLNSLLCCYFFRYTLSLHGTWLVNSAAHLYGTRPYDKNLQPVESWFVSFISLGEGWHNYHHAFPWDYKAAELTMHFNLTATFIRFFEKIGWAYDLKSVSPEMVTNRILRTGDGTHYELGDEELKKAVTANGILHPLNPSYNVTYKAPEIKLKPEGLPLFHEKDVLKQDK
ncbi:acyl-CoA Delta-9 desaturase-like [Amyelois transitella]|uniref:acyl-CoA Delta-9 desaturase-like n=1 Tax=Amyelois transitella TaxID=680683 RepID=UPI00067A797C|nr:acyl-CoA Delta-9 desaturase-like [Amyelois transitella]